MPPDRGEEKRAELSAPHSVLAIEVHPLAADWQDADMTTWAHDGRWDAGARDGANLH